MTTITDYHAKYFAHELSKRHSVADAEKLAGALLIFVDYFRYISSFRPTGINVETGVWIAHDPARCISYVCFLLVCTDMFVAGDLR